jgi:glutathione S-transferase
MFPKRLAAVRRRLLACAAENPDLASVYTARAEAFAGRIRAFDPGGVARVAEQRRAEAIGFMDRLEQALADGRAVLVPPAYGVADIVWTVFLARMEFAGLGAEIVKRPAVARYWRAMQARPSFSAADIWTKFHALRLIGGILGIAGA